jgi:hypothetical protein
MQPSQHSTGMDSTDLLLCPQAEGTGKKAHLLPFSEFPECPAYVYSDTATEGLGSSVAGASSPAPILLTGKWRSKDGVHVAQRHSVSGRAGTGVWLFNPL